MSTNVYCDLCGKEVRHDDSFVVETKYVVHAYHNTCGQRIADALVRSLKRDSEPVGSPQACALDFPAGDGTRELLPPDIWKLRDLEDRLAASETLVRQVASVWRLWLSDAEKGAINPGTFNAMRTLLGME